MFLIVERTTLLPRSARTPSPCSALLKRHRPCLSSMMPSTTAYSAFGWLRRSCCRRAQSSCFPSSQAGSHWIPVIESKAGQRSDKSRRRWSIRPHWCGFTLPLVYISMKSAAAMESWPAIASRRSSPACPPVGVANGNESWGSCGAGFLIR